MDNPRVGAWKSKGEKKKLDERKSPGGMFVINPLIKNTKQGYEGSISAS